MGNQRPEPSHARGVRLDGENPVKAVYHKARQPVGLGVDQPIIWRLEKPLAEPQRALDPASEEAAVDCTTAVAIEEAGGKEAVRVEHPDPERAAIGPPQVDQRTGR